MEREMKERCVYILVHACCDDDDDDDDDVS